MSEARAGLRPEASPCRSGRHDAAFARFYLQPRDVEGGRPAGSSAPGRAVAFRPGTWRSMIQMGRLGDFGPLHAGRRAPAFTYTDGIPSHHRAPGDGGRRRADPIREDRLRAAVFDRVSSEHKRFIFLPGAGHVDQLYLMDLEEIFGWLEERVGEG